MRRLRVWLMHARGLLGTGSLDRDLRDQIEAHLEEATEEYARQGLSPAEARRAARRAFGSIVQVEEAFRDARAPWLRDATKDLRHGLRSLRRNPVFSTVAILSLALGIGANTAIFSVVNSVVLRPRAVLHPDEVVELYTGDRDHPYETCSYPSYVELHDRNEVLSGLAGYSIRQLRLTDPNEAEDVWGEVVTGNYFEVLGVRPAHGRALRVGDDLAPGGSPIVVIADTLWQRRFDADPDVVGRTINVNNQELTVVGIAPPQYTGMIRGLASEMWIPATAFPLLDPASGQARLTDRGSRWLSLVGRLLPGTTVEQAQARFDVLSREMQATHPEEWRSREAEAGPFRELFVTVRPERATRIPPSMHLDAFALVGLVAVLVNVVLLIACINLACMLLARAVSRRKEMAIRLALGASRWRLIRQLLAESVLLSLIAGALGVVLTTWLLHAVRAFMPAFPEGIRLALDLGLDWRVLAYGLAFSTVTGVLFGLAPALRSSRADVSTALKDSDGAVAGGRRESRSRRALVVAQVAFAVVLLVGSGLVLRSLDNVRPTRLGFASDRVLVAPLSLDPTRYDRHGSEAFYGRVLERVASLPGVETASLVEGMPGGFLSRSRRSTEIEGYRAAPDESLHIDAIYAGPRYFTNMKVPIVQGRDFDERDVDAAPCVAVVNEVFARRYFAASTSPLGMHLSKYDEESPEGKEMCEVVGVIHDDAWQSLQRTMRPFYALALLQSPQRSMTLLINTRTEPASQVAPVRRIIQDLDARMPVKDVRTLVDTFSVNAYPFRLLGYVMVACGVAALLLATIGIYGIVSYSVAQRSREVGIRMALGAMKHDVLAMIVGQGMALVACGLVLGILLSAGLTRVLGSSLFETDLLFGVSASDSLTYAFVTGLLALVAAAACYVPALRAARVDPIAALRYE